MRVSIPGPVRPASVLIAAFAVGCASTHHPAPPPALSSQFFGVWVNTGHQARNWWEISSTDVILYGIDSAGRCESTNAVVVDAEDAQVRIGTTTAGSLHLQGDLLMFMTDAGQVGLSQRTDATTICRKPDGTYAEDAPHPAPSR
jgi:hypothetical protein